MGARPQPSGGRARIPLPTIKSSGGRKPALYPATLNACELFSCTRGRPPQEARRRPQERPSVRLLTPCMFGKGGACGRHTPCPSLSRPGATKSAQNPNPAPATNKINDLCRTRTSSFSPGAHPPRTRRSATFTTFTEQGREGGRHDRGRAYWRGRPLRVRGHRPRGTAGPSIMCPSAEPAVRRASEDHDPTRGASASQVADACRSEPAPARAREARGKPVLCHGPLLSHSSRASGGIGGPMK